MRKLNSIAAILVMILFVIHMVAGGMTLAGMINGGNLILSNLTRLLRYAISVHMILSLILTVQTVYAMRKSGVSYGKANRLFWIRRISGFALMFFIIIHVRLFAGHMNGPAYRLNLFGGPQLISQILMVITLMVHLICNISPLRIALGITDRKNFRTDIMLVLSILLLLAGIAFLMYFIRWGAEW